MALGVGVEGNIALTLLMLYMLLNSLLLHVIHTQCGTLTCCNSSTTYLPFTLLCTLLYSLSSSYTSVTSQTPVLALLLVEGNIHIVLKWTLWYKFVYITNL